MTLTFELDLQILKIISFQAHRHSGLFAVAGPLNLIFTVLKLAGAVLAQVFV